MTDEPVIGALLDGRLTAEQARQRGLVARAIGGLVKKRVLVEAEHPKHKGAWLALSKLVK